MITLKKVRVNVERGYIEYPVDAVDAINIALAAHGLGGSLIEERVPAYKGEPTESAGALPRLARWLTGSATGKPVAIAPGVEYKPWH